MAWVGRHPGCTKKEEGAERRREGWREEAQNEYGEENGRNGPVHEAEIRGSEG